jgi:hypothetical protein
VAQSTLWGQPERAVTLSSPAVVSNGSVLVGAIHVW